MSTKAERRARAERVILPIKVNGQAVDADVRRKDTRRRPQRCPDCGEEGERKGHQACQYPRD